MSKTSHVRDEEKYPREINEALKANDAIVDVLFDWHREVINFYGHRFEQYAELPARISNCQSPRTLHELQSQFFDTMFSDYRDKATELFGLTQQLTGQTLQQDDRHYEKTILKAQDDAKKLLRQAKENAERIIQDAEAVAERVLKDASRNKGKVA